MYSIRCVPNGKWLDDMYCQNDDQASVGTEYITEQVKMKGEKSKLICR